MKYYSGNTYKNMTKNSQAMIDQVVAVYVNGKRVQDLSDALIGTDSKTCLKTIQAIAEKTGRNIRDFEGLFFYGIYSNFEYRVYKYGDKAYKLSAKQAYIIAEWLCEDVVTLDGLK